MNFLKKEFKAKNTIIQILSKNQSCFSKQSQSKIFTKYVLHEKSKIHAKHLITSNRFSVLARKNDSDLPTLSSTVHLEEQLCTRKDITSLRKSMATPNNDKNSDKPNKDLSKRNSDSSKNTVAKRYVRQKTKTF